MVQNLVAGAADRRDLPARRVGRARLPGPHDPRHIAGRPNGVHEPPAAMRPSYSRFRRLGHLGEDEPRCTSYTPIRGAPCGSRTAWTPSKRRLGHAVFRRARCRRDGVRRGSRNTMLRCTPARVRGCMRRATACVQKNVPRVFTSKHRSKLSTETSSKLAPAQHRRPRCPRASTPRTRARCLRARARAREVRMSSAYGLKRRPAAATRRPQFRHALRISRATAADVESRPRQRQHDRMPDTARGAGDDGRVFVIAHTGRSCRPSRAAANGRHGRTRSAHETRRFASRIAVRQRRDFAPANGARISRAAVREVGHLRRIVPWATSSRLDHDRAAVKALAHFVASEPHRVSDGRRPSAQPSASTPRQHPVRFGQSTPRRCATSRPIRVRRGLAGGHPVFGQVRIPQIAGASVSTHNVSEAKASARSLLAATTAGARDDPVAVRAQPLVPSPQ